MSTGIQWCDETWNAIAAFDRETGKRGWFCAHVSPGCEHCYAEAFNRFRGNGHDYTAQNAKRVECRIVETLLTKPLTWRKPRKVFVCSMTDLFLDEHADEMIDRVFAVMMLAQRHTFQVLTKRAERMRAYLSKTNRRSLIDVAAMELLAEGTLKDSNLRELTNAWPLPNVWLGVTVEDQRRANERIPDLVNSPAAVRFLSCEPLLSGVQIAEYLPNKLWNNLPSWKSPEIDWVIVGGESGRGAREFDLAWARNIVAQCKNANVAVFVKQMGSNPVDPWAHTGALVNGRESARPDFAHSHGGDMSEWPSDLQIREFPAVAV